MDIVERPVLKLPKKFKRTITVRGREITVSTFSRNELTYEPVEQMSEYIPPNQPFINESFNTDIALQMTDLGRRSRGKSRGRHGKK